MKTLFQILIYSFGQINICFRTLSLIAIILICIELIPRSNAQLLHSVDQFELNGVLTDVEFLTDNVRFYNLGRLHNGQVVWYTHPDSKSEVSYISPTQYGDNLLIRLDDQINFDVFYPGSLIDIMVTDSTVAISNEFYRDTLIGSDTSYIHEMPGRFSAFVHQYDHGGRFRGGTMWSDSTRYQPCFQKMTPLSEGYMGIGVNFRYYKELNIGTCSFLDSMPSGSDYSLFYSYMNADNTCQNVCQILGQEPAAINHIISNVHQQLLITAMSATHASSMYVCGEKVQGSTFSQSPVLSLMDAYGDLLYTACPQLEVGVGQIIDVDALSDGSFVAIVFFNTGWMKWGDFELACDPDLSFPPRMALFKFDTTLTPVAVDWIEDPGIFFAHQDLIETKDGHILVCGYTDADTMVIGHKTLVKDSLQSELTYYIQYNSNLEVINAFVPQQPGIPIMLRSNPQGKIYSIHRDDAQRQGLKYRYTTYAWLDSISSVDEIAHDHHETNCQLILGANLLSSGALLQVDTDCHAAIRRINIFDYSGKLVMHSNANGLNRISINTNQLTNGHYIIQCLTDDGRWLQSKMVVW